MDHRRAPLSFGYTDFKLRLSIVAAGVVQE